VGSGVGEKVAPGNVGPTDGENVCLVGEVVGVCEGGSVGALTGFCVYNVGLTVGDHVVPAVVGAKVGASVVAVGVIEGATVDNVGPLVGGGCFGSRVGTLVGLVVVCVGLSVGE
jgi:hypothetical protein